MSNENEPFLVIAQNIQTPQVIRPGVIGIEYSAQQIVTTDFQVLRIEGETLVIVHGITELGQYENRVDLRNVFGVTFTYDK